MSDNNTTMRNMLTLLEGVAGSTTQLNESNAAWAASKEKEKENALTSKDKATYAKIRQMLDKEKKSVKEDSLPDHLDPNLSKAYNLGNQTYLAYRDNPEMAQAAQDRFDEMPIVKQNPQYAEMWVRGYRDGERFAKQKTNEASAGYKKVIVRDLKRWLELAKQNEYHIQKVSDDQYQAWREGPHGGPHNTGFWFNGNDEHEPEFWLRIPRA